MDSKVSFQEKEIMEKFQLKTFQPQYAKAFYELNKNWIEEYWELEQSDLNDLLNPITPVIEKGGEIFFILHKEVIIGTAAIIPLDNRIMELAKMTIHVNYRGLGLSKILLSQCISYAKNEKMKEIFLISNSKLKAARSLYDIFNFKEVPLDSKKYLRGDYKMLLKVED